MYKVTIMEGEEEDLIIYIRKGERRERVFSYLEFMCIETTRRVEIFLCYELIMLYNSNERLVEDVGYRAESKNTHNKNLEDLLRVNCIINTYAINVRFIKFFDSLINEYIFKY